MHIMQKLYLLPATNAIRPIICVIACDWFSKNLILCISWPNYKKRA